MDSLPRDIILSIVEYSLDPRPLAFCKHLHRVVSGFPEYWFFCKYIPSRRNIFRYGGASLYPLVRGKKLRGRDAVAACKNPDISLIRRFISLSSAHNPIFTLTRIAVEKCRVDVLRLCSNTSHKDTYQALRYQSILWYRADEITIQFLVDNHRDFVESDGGKMLLSAVSSGNFTVAETILSLEDLDCSNGVYYKLAWKAVKFDSLRIMKLVAPRVQRRSLFDAILRGDSLRMFIWALDNGYLPEHYITKKTILVVKRDALQIFAWCAAKNLINLHSEGVMSSVVNAANDCFDRHAHGIADFLQRHYPRVESATLAHV